MERAKQILFAGLGAMAALTIYGAASTKKASTEGGRTDRLARIEALMNEGSAKYRPSFFRRAIKRHAQPERLAGLDTTKTVTEVAPTEPVKPDAKAEEAKKAAEKKAADEKKKKEDEAKKKKKKKKKKKAGDTSTEEATPGDQAANDDEEDSKPKDDPRAIVSSGGLTTYSTPNQVDPNKTPETIEEWIAYLTVSPSLEKTNKFIQLAQVNSVKADVFFPVCEKLMTLDQRLQEFGTMALGSVMHVTSFEYLANIANEPEFTDKVKKQATAYMNQYARVEYVRMVGEAVLSKDAVAANNAITIIQRSLPNLRQAAAATTSTPESTAATIGTPTSATPVVTRAPASSVVKIYEAIVANLITASQTGVDSGVRSTSRIMADSINAMLTSISPTTSTVVSN